MTGQPEATADRPARSQPESLRLRGITVSLTVSDLAASVKWYDDVVGFTVTERHEHEGALVAATLMAGSVRLVLGQDDWAKGRDRVKGVGTRLYFTTAQDVDELAARIQARGGTLESGPQEMSWGPRGFFLTDPDGFRLAILADG